MPDVHLIFPDWDPPPVVAHMDPVPHAGEHVVYEENIYEVAGVVHRLGHKPTPFGSLVQFDDSRTTKIALDLKYLGPTAAGMGLLDTDPNP
jgi:hypothetical protein